MPQQRLKILCDATKTWNNQIQYNEKEKLLLNILHIYICLKTLKIVKLFYDSSDIFWHCIVVFHSFNKHFWALIIW